MYRVEIPLSRLERMPAVCPISGSTEGLAYRRLELRWHPKWVYLLLPLGLIVALIAAAITSRRASGNIPFGRSVYFRWVLGQVLFAFSVFGALVGGILGAIAMGQDSTVLGVAILLASASAPVAVWWTLVRNRGFVVREITDSIVVLSIPSQRAAAALGARVTGEPTWTAGPLERAATRTSRAPERTLCAWHADIQAAWTCGRCGSFFCPRCAEYPSRGRNPVCASCFGSRDAR
jgi:hypothetical protein